MGSVVRYDDASQERSSDCKKSRRYDGRDDDFSHFSLTFLNFKYYELNKRLVKLFWYGIISTETWPCHTTLSREI